MEFLNEQYRLLMKRLKLLHRSVRRRGRRRPERNWPEIRAAVINRQSRITHCQLYCSQSTLSSYPLRFIPVFFCPPSLYLPLSLFAMPRYVYRYRASFDTVILWRITRDSANVSELDAANNVIVICGAKYQLFESLRHCGESSSITTSRPRDIDRIDVIAKFTRTDGLRVYSRSFFIRKVLPHLDYARNSRWEGGVTWDSCHAEINVSLWFLQT